MTFTLKQGLSQPDQDSQQPALSQQQQREQALEQQTANLEKITAQIDPAMKSPDLLDHYPKEIQGHLKQALAQKAYLIGGENAKIDNVKILNNGDLEASVNTWLYASVNPEKVIADYHTMQQQVEQKSEIPLTPEEQALAQKFETAAQQKLGEINEVLSAINTRMQIEGDGNNIEVIKADIARASTLNQQRMEISKILDQPLAEQIAYFKNFEGADSAIAVAEQTLDKVIEQSIDNNMTAPSIQQPEVQPTVAVSEAQLNEINGIYENRLTEINQELQAITERRNIEGYWESNLDVINADMTHANALTQERGQLYDVMDQSPQAQLAYLEAHPELQVAISALTTDQAYVAQKFAEQQQEIQGLQDTIQAELNALPVGYSIERNGLEREQATLNQEATFLQDLATHPLAEQVAHFQNLDQQWEQTVAKGIDQYASTLQRDIDAITQLRSQEIHWKSPELGWASFEHLEHLRAELTATQAITKALPEERQAFYAKITKDNPVHQVQSEILNQHQKMVDSKGILSVSEHDISITAYAKRGLAVGAGVAKGTGTFLYDSAEGIVNLGAGTVKYAGSNYVKTADTLTGGYLAQNFEAVRASNHYYTETTQMLGDLAYKGGTVAMNVGITGVSVVNDIKLDAQSAAAHALGLATIAEHYDQKTRIRDTDWGSNAINSTGDLFRSAQNITTTYVADTINETAHAIQTGDVDRIAKTTNHLLTGASFFVAPEVFLVAKTASIGGRSLNFIQKSAGFGKVEVASSISKAHASVMFEGIAKESLVASNTPSTQSMHLKNAADISAGATSNGRTTYRYTAQTNFNPPSQHPSTPMASYTPNELPKIQLNYGNGAPQIIPPNAGSITGKLETSIKMSGDNGAKAGSTISKADQASNVSKAEKVADTIADVEKAIPDALFERKLGLSQDTAKQPRVRDGEIYGAYVNGLDDAARKLHVEQLREKYGRFTPEELNQRLNLRQATLESLQEFKLTQKPVNRVLGPALCGCL